MKIKLEDAAKRSVKKLGTFQSSLIFYIIKLVTVVLFNHFTDLELRY